jgi:hypothetical protein
MLVGLRAIAAALFSHTLIQQTTLPVQQAMAEPAEQVAMALMGQLEVLAPAVPAVLLEQV